VEASRQSGERSFEANQISTGEWNMNPCDYENDGFRITQPGKFEGEPVWVPSFWEAGLSGLSDDDDGEYYGFMLTDQDRKDWPMLAGFTRVALREDSSGFVHSHTYV
jgi:hypothetical protein